MSTINVTVKWGKKKFEAVELDKSAPVDLFKAQLFALTNVPVERQKIMGVKGGTVKDGADWEALGVKQGQVLMLMGSAEAVPEAPAEKTIFVEDMPAVDVAALTASKNPGGLTNLGNTCYLNSSLQVMIRIPEVSLALQKYAGTGGESEKALLFAMRELVGELERSNATQEVRPFKFVSVFRQNFPMFAQQAEGGRGFVQQDAQECWSTLVTNVLAQRLKLPDGGAPSDLDNASPPLLPHQQELRDNLGDALFGVEKVTRYACAEAGGEEPYEKREKDTVLKCHINEKTAHLYTAVEASLSESIEKHSAALGREALFDKTEQIARLPPYLAVNFVRFQYRKDTEKRAKILRPISFPDVLDVRNLCTKELQANIASHNNRLEEARDKAAADKASADKAAADKAAAAAAPADTGEHTLAGAAALAAKPAEPTPMETEGAGSSGEADRSKAVEEIHAEAARIGPVHALECDNRTGQYELFGIITHQGRTAEGGHYVAWVKRDAKTWLVFDDETVAEVDAPRIKELYGGGDWHIAYMCLYRKMETLSLEEE